MGTESSETPHVPAGVDVTKPSVARVYDALLGGKDNFEVDRQMAARLTEVYPEAKAMVRNNRAWLRRVVAWLAGEAGVDQFLDLGSGLPTADNTHEVAQLHNPDAVVVYVDNDPSVAAFGRALLEDNPNSHFCAGDYTEPAVLLADPIVADNLDLTRPVAVLHLLTLHLIADQAAALACVTGYLDRAAAGSYVAITHTVLVPEGDPRRSRVEETMARAREYASNMTMRPVGDIEAFAGGLEIIEPGVVPVSEWRADGPQRTLVDADTIVGLVARKP